MFNFLNLVLLSFLCRCSSSSLRTGHGRIIYSTKKNAYILDLDNPPMIGPSKLGQTILDDLPDFSHFDVIGRNGTFFWTDLEEMKIKSAQYFHPFLQDYEESPPLVQTPSPTSSSLVKSTNSSNLPLVKITNLQSINIAAYDDLAVDWLSGVLYWINSEEGVIEVGSQNGKTTGVLLWENMDQPRHLVLDPPEGYMYWADVGTAPRIERCGLNGKGRSLILKGPLIGHPVALAVDSLEERIYWSDQEMKGIYTADFNGKDLRKVISFPSSASHSPSFFYPFNMAVGGAYLYYIDNDRSKLKAVDKSNFSAVVDVWKFPVIPREMKLLDRQLMTVDRGKVCDSSSCSHLCLTNPEPPFFTCGCPTGILLGSDNMTCANGPSKMLLLARSSDIRRISLDTLDFTDVPVVVGNDLSRMVAIDYDPVEETVYWSDTDLQVIKRSKIGTGDMETLLENGVHTCEGLAVDWLARNLYWTDTGTDRIEVMRLEDRSSRKVVVEDHLDEPRSIVVDPYEGYLFWTDWGDNTKIERSSLDGSNRIVVVDRSIAWPNGLALDRPMKKLYWADAKLDIIQSSNYDGSGRSKVDSGDVPHIFGLSLIDEYIYWTDWQRRVVERAHKVTGKSRSVLIEDLPDLMGLVAVYSKIRDVPSGAIREGAAACRLNNGGCSHFCFWGSGDEKDGEIHRCGCPDDFHLSSLENKTCMLAAPQLLFNIGNGKIKMMSLHDDDDDDEGKRIIDGGKSNDDYDDDDRIGRKDGDIIEGDEGEDNGEYNGYYVLNPTESFPSTTSPSPSSRSLSVKFGSRIEEMRLKSGKISSFDYLYDERMIFWVDSETWKMSSSHFNDTSSVQTLHSITSSRNFTPTLSVDWLSKNIYWTTWNRIEMSRHDGKNRLVVAWKKCRPTSMTVDPVNGFLFWSNKINRGTIEKSFLDGTKRSTIIGNIGHVTGMICDPETKYLYWADAKLGQIERASYKGSSRTILVSRAEPFKLALFKDFVYWSDTARNMVIATNRKIGGEEPIVISEGLSVASDVKVVHSSLQKGHSSCSMSKSCSHLCINFPREQFNSNMTSSVTHRCVCPNQQVLSKKDNSTCEASSITAFLALPNKIISFSLAEISGRPDLTLPFQPMTPVKSLEFDHRRGVLYFVVGNNSIVSVTTDGSEMFDILSSSTIFPFDLALDIVDDLLYWSEMTSNTIVMTSLRGTPSHTTLNFSRHDSLRKPRYLAIATEKRILFWTNEIGSIERADLRSSLSDSTTSSNIIVHGEGIGPLCIDHSMPILYWFNEKLHSIETAGFNGEERKVLVEGVRSVAGMGTGSERLYWADIMKETLESCMRNTGEHRTIDRSRLPSNLKDFVLVYRKNQKVKNKGQVTAVDDDTVSVDLECPVTCSHGCILGQNKCKCPAGTVSSKDGTACWEVLPKCPVNHFSCRVYVHQGLTQVRKRSVRSDLKMAVDDPGSVCIPSEWTCDGDSDCADSSDEKNCTSCNKGAVLCEKDGKCTRRNLLCDGTFDCSDGSDEKDCMFCSNKLPVTDSEDVKCDIGTCYSVQHGCDLHPDCQNGEDEKGCRGAVAGDRGLSYLLSAMVCFGVIVVIVCLFFILRRKKKSSLCPLSTRKSGFFSATKLKTKVKTSQSTMFASAMSSPRASNNNNDILVECNNAKDRFLNINNHDHSSRATLISSLPYASVEDLRGPCPSLADTYLSCSDKNRSDADYGFPLLTEEALGLELSIFPTPPPPTPCSQPLLLSSRQTSTTSSLCGNTPLGFAMPPGSPGRSRRVRIYQARCLPPHLDCLDPCLVLPPSGRSSGLSTECESFKTRSTNSRESSANFRHHPTPTYTS